MQIKLFTIPIGDSGASVGEMNRFLRSHKILEIQSQFISTENGASWCFCVRYIENALPIPDNKKGKVDYRYVLDEVTFKKFSKLREIRKKITVNDGIPAFAIFTDEELAALAGLESITEKGMRSIKGIGDKKIERYARYFIESSQVDEKTGTS